MLLLRSRAGTAQSAEILPEPSLSDKAIAYGREKGFCKGPAAGYKATINEAEKQIEERR